MNKPPFVIGISGAVGSGKSWFANKLRKAIPDTVCIFTLDSYSKGKEYVDTLEFRYDNPDAINYDDAFLDISKLLRGEIVNIPVYDYMSHTVVSEETFKSPAVLILEGLYAFSDQRFLDIMDLKVWIEVDEETCLRRRINRDIAERGETREDSMARHKNDSEPAYRKYYAKGRILSDCVYYNQQEQSNDNLRLVDLIRTYYEQNK